MPARQYEAAWDSSSTGYDAEAIRDYGAACAKAALVAAAALFDQPHMEYFGQEIVDCIGAIDVIQS